MEKLHLNRFGLGQTIDFVFDDAAIGTQDIQTLKTFHNVTDLADFTADTQTRMLGHVITSYFYIVHKITFSDYLI